MTTLSLFDEPDALDPEPTAGAPLDPDTVRDLRELLPAIRPVRSGGLALPVLAFATLVASPALWQGLVRHAVPMNVMLGRYAVIAVGCLLVAVVVRRLLRQAVPGAVRDGASRDGASRDGASRDGAADDAADAPVIADTPVMPAAVTADPLGAGPTDPALALLAAEG